MAILAPAQVDQNGATVGPTAAAAASQRFLTGDNVYLLIKNADASSHTATVDDKGSAAPAGANTFDGDVPVVVAEGTTVLAGPFRRQRFGDDDGLADIAWSATTSMTVAVVRL